MGTVEWNTIIIPVLLGQGLERFELSVTHKIELGLLTQTRDRLKKLTELESLLLQTRLVSFIIQWETDFVTT